MPLLTKFENANVIESNTPFFPILHFPLLFINEPCLRHAHKPITATIPRLQSPTPPHPDSGAHISFPKRPPNTREHHAHIRPAFRAPFYPPIIYHQPYRSLPATPITTPGPRYKPLRAPTPGFLPHAKPHQSVSGVLRKKHV